MTPSNEQITTWIARLDTELAGDDPALRRDAVGDASDHLTAEYERLGPDASDAAVTQLLDAYGDPVEVADSYRAAERLLGGAPRDAAPAPVEPMAPETPERPARWFAVAADPQAWSSLLYMLLALPFGIAWFTWVVTGASLSAGLLILIIGVPIALVFLATTRGIALLDGRIVEALLGERMPRRTLSTPRDTKGVVARVKYWLADARTWTSLVYLLLMLPLGIAYFVTAVTIGAVSLALATGPILLAVAQVDTGIDPSVWNWVIAFAMVPAGILGWFGLLHLARAVGGLHGRFAKAMLVGGEGRANRRDPVSVPGSIGRAAALLAITALVAGAGLGGSASYVHANSERVTQDVRAKGVQTIRLDLTTADVTFALDDALDEGDLRVEASGRLYDDAAKDAKLVTLDTAGDVATLRADCPDDTTLFDFGCDVELTVFLPADGSTSLRGATNTGDVLFLDARFETIDIETDTGDIEGRVDAERITLTSDTGDIELDSGEQARAMDVETDTGDVELTLVGSWRIEATTDTGDREVVGSDASADRRLRVTTDTGDIEVHAVDGDGD